MSFEELKAAATPSAPEPAPPPPPPQAEASPWDETPATGGETKAFPRMSFEELKQMATPTPAPEPEPEPEPQPEPQAAAEPAPWEAPVDSTAVQDISTFRASEPAPMASQSSAPWDEPPAMGSETRAFPPMSFEETPQTASQPEQEEAPAPEPEREPMFAPSEPAAEEVPFAASQVQEQEPMPAPAAAAESSVSEPARTEAFAGAMGDLTDEQVDRIARRVVQLMSDQVVKNIAWEVIPDLAEMVVKERIRQLESEA
jgi:hypothetical protein